MNAARQAKQSLVSGDYVMTADDFAQIATTLKEMSGIVLSDGKVALAYSRLAKRLRILGLNSFAEYCAMIDSADGADELQAMLAALTTNVTRFYREPHHFDTLHDLFLTDLAQKARSGERVRLWSAACSNGQEPYSMAMTVLTAMPDAASHDVRILATDIDPNMVAEGRDGTYRSELLDPVPPQSRQRFFEASYDGQLTARGSLRELTRFNVLNLLGSWPMKHKFDAIFCRNVAIYFDEPTQERIWARFAQCLHEGAHLFIGHSERVSGPAERYFEATGLTTYRRRRA
jgi:chemotaxis protein methyltransferase CheR